MSGKPRAEAASGLNDGLGEPKRWSMEWNQQKCLDLGFKYWRAPDAHGVTCTREQAIEFMQEMLGVEVDIKDA